MLEHLIKKVFSLQDTKTVPDHTTLKLPKHPDELVLDTKSAAQVDIDASLLAKEDSKWNYATKERFKLDNLGSGDQLDKLQESSWPIEKLLAGGFNSICVFPARMVKVMILCSGTRELFSQL
jgi:hypothetical protein